MSDTSLGAIIAPLFQKQFGTSKLGFGVKKPAVSLAQDIATMSDAKILEILRYGKRKYNDTWNNDKTDNATEQDVRDHFEKWYAALGTTTPKTRKASESIEDQAIRAVLRQKLTDNNGRVRMKAKSADELLKKGFEYAWECYARHVVIRQLSASGLTEEQLKAVPVADFVADNMDAVKASLKKEIDDKAEALRKLATTEETVTEVIETSDMLEQLAKRGFKIEPTE
jgi:hypothetical protein